MVNKLITGKMCKIAKKTAINMVSANLDGKMDVILFAHALDREWYNLSKLSGCGSARL